MNVSLSLFLDHAPQKVVRIPNNVKSVGGLEYEVGERIASGGNAVVHRCSERITGDEYAVKFQLSLSEKRTKRFHQEVELLRKVHHDQLMKYIDHGDIEATFKEHGTTKSRKICYVVMPIAEANLRQRLENKSDRLLYEEYIAQFRGLAEALSVLHQEAVHRDIKPENILVNGETWILTDFGLCKSLVGGDDLSDPEEVIGPRYWMSPEAVNRAVGNADVVAKSSDVYQLCSVFWYVVTGRNPSGCVCAEDWKGPADLFPVIYTALAHDCRKRPQDGSDLLQRLNSVTVSQA